MEYVKVILEFGIIVVAAICIRSKNNMDITIAASCATMMISLVVFSVIGIVNLIIGRGIMLEHSALDYASSIALIYVINTLYLINKKKKNSRINYRNKFTV